MKIGVIGVGSIGGTIARKLSEKGHSVKVANSRGKEAVKEFADEIGACPSDLDEISDDIDALIVSIPYNAINSLPESVFSSPPAFPADDCRFRIMQSSRRLYGVLCIRWIAASLSELRQQRCPKYVSVFRNTKGTIDEWPMHSGSV